MNLAYITDITILLSAAAVVVPLSRFLGLGIVPGFLIAGIVVGPSTLSLIDNQTEIAHISELGVVFLLFVIGIELKPSRLWLMRNMVFGLGALQVILVGLVISAIAHFMFGVDSRSAILIGPVLALSSTAFVLQLLSEQKLLASDYGRTSVAILLFQDLAVVPLLALASLLMVANMTISGDIGLELIKSLGILVLIIVGAHYLLQPVLERVAQQGSPEFFTAFAVLLVLGTALLMEKIGLSMAMGAFVAGVLIADSEFRHQIVAEIQPFRGLLIGMFFMSMGMSLELSVLFTNPLISVGLVVILLVVKAIVLWPLVVIFGHKGKNAMAVSLLLAQSGEFALIIFAMAYDGSLLDKALYQQLLLVVILSMLATPPLAGLAYRLVVSLKGNAKDSADMAHHPSPKGLVIIGFGRVGRQVGEMLEARDVAYCAVDIDAQVVKRERSLGRSVFYGDARRPDVLRSLGVEDAGLVIVTMDDFKAAEQVVSSLNRTFPDIDILARGHNLENCQSLRVKGARLVLSENIEASIALAQEALTKVQQGDEENEKVIERYRSNYYAAIEAGLEKDVTGR